MEKQGQAGGSDSQARLGRDALTDGIALNSSGSVSGSKPSMTERIREVRTALAELREDNKRNGSRVAWQLVLLIVLLALLTIPAFSPGSLELLGIPSGNFEPTIMSLAVAIWSATLLPWTFISVFLDRSFHTGRQLEEQRQKKQEEFHLYRIRNLDGSGLAEEFLADALGNGRLSDALSRKTGLQVNSKTGNVRDQLKSLFGSCRSVPERGLRGPVIAETGWTSILILLVPGFYFAFQIGFAHVVLLAIISAVIATAIWIGKRNNWRVGLLYFEDYLDKAMDYYELHGSLDQPEYVREAAPAEIIGSRLHLNMEAVCAEIRRHVNGLESDPNSAGMARMVIGIALCVGVPLLGMNYSLSIAANIAVIMIGVTALLLGIIWASDLHGKLESYTETYRQRIRQRGLVEQWLSGTLPVSDLQEASPVWLRGLLYVPFTPPGLEHELGRNAWLMMWNLDWFLKGEGSSVRIQIPIAVLAALLLLGFVCMLPYIDVGPGVLHPFLSAALIAGSSVACYRQVVARTMRQAGALATLDEMEDRLLGPAESSSSSAFGISNPTLD